MKPRLFLVVGLVLLGACSDATFVDGVTIENDTVYSADVAVRGRNRGWLALITVPAGQTRKVSAVIDQGEIWTFRFTYAGRVEVDTTVSRSDLAEADWRVSVPEEFEDRLRDEGVAPPP